MGASQRAKGARGEREACKHAAARLGTAYERTGSAQRRQGSTLPDIRPVDRDSPLDLLHIEVKIGKRPSLWGALKQANDACKESGRIPVVLARVDRGPWVWLYEDQHAAVVAAAMRNDSCPETGA